MRRIWSLLALLLLCCPADATSPAEQPYRIASYGRLVTEVYVNGQGPFTFLIDTASSRSLIFEHVRQKLGLARSQLSIASGQTGSSASTCRSTLTKSGAA